MFVCLFYICKFLCFKVVLQKKGRDFLWRLQFLTANETLNSLILFSTLPLPNILIFCFCYKNYKYSVLKQHKFIILWFCRLKVQHVSHWTKIKVLAGLCFFWESLKENPFNLPFPVSRGYLHFLTHSLPLPFQN